MNATSEVMALLETGHWFSFEDLASKCSFPKCQVELVLNFLTKFEFVQKDEIKNFFRLSPRMKKLIKTLNEKSA